jgi:hypothetical protein
VDFVEPPDEDQRLLETTHLDWCKSINLQPTAVSLHADYVNDWAHGYAGQVAVVEAERRPRERIREIHQDVNKHR